MVIACKQIQSALGISSTDIFIVAQIFPDPETLGYLGRKPTCSVFGFDQQYSTAFGVILGSGTGD
ncbi:hypothetical protein SDC9_129275 [bioreactor metagenome]|uniref:Uncharacterized protein n=1 Tax=bioreactor metagenome TaxID=1076179 RepID=A0A645CZ19_9ZZZZ